ncbi:MAG: glycoside hydrolase family 31 protein [Caldilineales bacterium]
MATPPLHSLGAVTAFSFADQCLDLHCGAAALRIELLAPALLRLRLAPDGHFDHGFSYAVARTEWPATPVEFRADDEVLELRSAALICRVQRVPCRLSIWDAQERLLLADAAGLGWSEPVNGDRAVAWHLHLPEGAHYYGLGEKAFPMERRGRRFELYNTDPAGYAPYDEPINQSIPFFMALLPVSFPLTAAQMGNATAAAGVLLDNPARSFFDFGYTQPDTLSIEAEAGELRAYVMAAPRLADVLESYTALTGRSALPPLWALGYHQARWSYPDEATVRDLAAQFRRRRIPCDAVYLDIDYMDGYRCFTWNRAAFPDPRGMIADLRGAGIKTVAIIDAGVKADAATGYAVHDEGVARDVFLRTADGERFMAPVWPGDCYFPDFTDPAARAWWGEQYAGLLADGVAGFWNDMNEPALFDGHVLPDDAPFHYEGFGARHSEAHNVYGTQMARATADGLARLQPGLRQLVISRAAFAGHQRHAMVWTGDNHSTWEHLRLTVAMGLSLGLSGLAFHGADVGGFMGDCTGELLARWTQLGALTPFFRNHSSLGTRAQEPWAFGAEIEAICRRAIELRYRLLPLIYTAFWQNAQTGVPITRPLVLTHQYDPRVAALDDQFMLGDDLLAAPVLEPGARGRWLYLPAGRWYDFDTGARLEGGRNHWANAPLDTIPLFVRGGSVLPMQAVQQHTDEAPAATITLRVYAGIGESQWYEDDGRTMACLTGEFRATRFAVRGDGGVVRVTVEHDGAYRSPRQHWAWEIIGLDRRPDSVEMDEQPISDWHYDESGHRLCFTTAPCLRIAVR